MTEKKYNFFTIWSTIETLIEEGVIPKIDKEQFRDELDHHNN